jgi:outer membrane receptor protein involved in Fe transport
MPISLNGGGRPKANFTDRIVTVKINKTGFLMIAMFKKISWRNLQNVLSTFLTVILVSAVNNFAQSIKNISGVVITAQNERVANATVSVRTSTGRKDVITDGEGNFSLALPNEPVMLTVSGPNIEGKTFPISLEQFAQRLKLVINYTVTPIHEELIINTATIEPKIERRNEKIFESTLFSRDDQIFQTLDAGINAGQHEGGGKSLEIRRFGFNLDHGGVGGGLKVLTDNVQQNQGTQGHGQGYLGSLKSFSPELIKDVEILNGPFSAQYGDFSGLGVVHIKQREELPQEFTARLQGGSFHSFRSFLAFSPQIKNLASFIAYEHSQTAGPFINPLGYGRDNLTANLTFKISERRSVGFKFNGGRNDFRSSGQIPLDEVFAGRLDRFGFLDPDNGGKVRNGTLGIYFRDESERGTIVKLDGFISRSLFDLWSNFTFFLNDEINGDEVRQHDSRLQEGVNFQYLQPVKFGNVLGVFTAGANFHANQINVSLDRSIGRTPLEITTRADARVDNYALYAQQSFDFFDGHLHFEMGLRYDRFAFRINDRVFPNLSGTDSEGKFQPKFNFAWTPDHEIPVTLHFNYGRGITSQDARGIVRQPENPKLATTDFYQVGTSFNSERFSATFSTFLINRSNEQVYIPDDGSIELTDPSRSSGIEAKTSLKINRVFSFNAGITQVLDAFYRQTEPRVFLDSAPHRTVNGAITMNDLQGWTGSLRYRHINSYRLDGLDDSIRAAGFDIIDLSASKRLNRWLDLNFSIDNLTNKRYWETQNYFDSKLTPTSPIISRIHATPGYPVTLTVGATFRFGVKN